MENYISLATLLLLSALLLRMLFLPVKLGIKLLLHSGCGFLCLWLLNAATSFTGLLLPINAITVLIAGILGLPGIALIALLELFA